MRRIVRPLAVFGVASALTLSALLQIAVGSGASEGGKTAFYPGYDLTKLELLEPTLYHIEESYVEPGRINWEEMFTAGLQAIERRVPGCRFDRDKQGGLVHIEVGDYRTILELAEVGSRRDLQAHMSIVVAQLAKHLRADDIPHRAGRDAFAEIEYVMVNGMLHTLDPHSSLLPPDDATQMDEDNQGEFGGLGITIVDRDGKLTIEYPMKNTPAHRAGLMPDDHITRIDGESTINMGLDEAVILLRGKVGEAAKLHIMREGFDEPRVFSVVRAVIQSNPVEGEVLDGAIGYVSIKSFHDRVERDLHDVLARIHREAGGLKGLIIDLRGNPGGYLNQAVKVSDTFLSDGDIVSTVDRDGQRTDLERARRNAEPNYPIAVLVNSNSASASEIVAGALRNNQRAIIVGERSFGKGSVQTLHSYYDGSKLKITISKYLTPGERSIQGVGIPADIELVPAVVNTDKDPVEIGLFLRERVRREADLNRSLAQVSFDIEEPAYRIPYLAPAHQRRSADLSMSEDHQVQVARDILIAAGRSWRRSDVLASASRVVGSLKRSGQSELIEALSKAEIDWSDGPGAVGMPIKLTIDVPSGALKPGEKSKIILTAENTSEQTVYRAVAVATKHDTIEGREFVFGKLEPGEKRSFEHVIRLVDGYPSNASPVDFEVRDTKSTLGSVTLPILVESKKRPHLVYTYTFSDEDQNKLPEKGDIIKMAITVTNVGEGPAIEPFARLKNKSRTSVELIDASLDIGSKEGCEDCVGLAPNESWTGEFSFRLADAPERDAWMIELGVGDAKAYDHGSVVLAGFYDWYSQSEKVALFPGVELGKPSTRKEPPHIEITNSPPPTTDSHRATISGVVSDDQGIKHVMVWAGKDKIFYDGGVSGTLTTLPFTADAELSPGLNQISVLVIDNEGFRTSSSRLIYVSEAVAKSELPQ